MNGRTLVILFVLLATHSLPAQPPKPPFAITAFTPIQPSQTLRSENIGAPCFAVQFKMKDPFIPELDRAVVYLFDANNKLIHTLTQTDPRAFPSRTLAKLGKVKVDYPNIISSAEDLRPNVSYTLIFRHMFPDLDEREVYTPKTEIRWKYAVAVIGNEETYVYKVFPHWKRTQELEFKERKEGMEN